MQLDSTTIARYQPGGDVYAKLLDQYGDYSAAYIAAAAASGDGAKLSDAIATVRRGPAANDSTASILWKQLTTDPLAAPLDSANRVLGNSFLSFLRNPWVIVAGVLILFLSLGGGRWIAKKIFK